MMRATLPMSKARTWYMRHLMSSVAMGLLGLAVAQCQDVPLDQSGNIQNSMRNRRPEFLVRAEVNHATRDYREGDYLEVRVASEIDAFVYVLYQQADGRTFQVFPNQYQPDNRLRARQAVRIPDKEDVFRWSIGAPFGKEIVKVVASKKPIRELGAPELRHKRFNALAAKILKGVELELGAEKPSEWTEHDIEIHTYSANQSPVDHDARRFGVFFGVSEYEFNAEYETAAKGKAKLNLPCPHRDARTLAELLREVGQLADCRVFTNEHATRKQVEESITEWLPAISRPGDTIFIYFSGHGMRLDDLKPAEGDTVLAPHDTVTGDILLQLVERAKQGEKVDVRVAEWIDVVKNAGSKAGAELIRQTAVPDDAFGHWLQRLDGRQVVVILDICFAGGFAAGGKVDPEAGKDLVSRFAEQNLNRLKSIGQQECALLAASGGEQTSQVRPEGDLSVMTYYLVDLLQHSRGPVELKQSHQYCKEKMHEYFEQRRQQPEYRNDPGHEPRLFNYCSRPVFLKP